MAPRFTTRTMVLSALVIAGLLACSSELPVEGKQPASPSASATFDSSRAWEHLRRQVAFGPRPAGSVALGETRKYIIDQLKLAGIDSKEQSFETDTPVGHIKMSNVIATIPGARPDRIVIGSHFDTKRFANVRFVGASDAASSTAVALELGRLLKARRNPMTIELLFLDGEEATLPDWTGTDNTYGSRYYVEAARKSGTLAGLKTFILLDMVGDRNLTIRRDRSSTSWLNDVIWDTAARLKYGTYFLRESFDIGGDDHFPFLAAGVPSIDIIDFDYPAWHTPQDDLDHVGARSLQIVGDVVFASLPEIQKRLAH